VILLSLLALAGLGGTAVLTEWRANAREARAAASAPSEDRFVTVDGRRVHAVVEGSGPDLVMIHGSSGNTADFSFDLMHRLSDQYRVILFDRPGLGWSDPLPRGREGIIEQAQVLSKAAALLGAEAPLVLGQSYGGAVALAWAVTQPDTLSGLVLVSSPSQVWEGRLSRYYQVTSHPVGARLVVPLLTAYVGPDRVAAELRGVFHPQPVPDGYLDHLNLDLTLSRRAVRENARHRARLKGDIAGLQPLYGQIEMPVEMIHGNEDITVPLSIHAAPLAQQLPGANLVVLDGVGHVPHHGTSANAVAAAVDRAAARAALHGGS